MSAFEIVALNEATPQLRAPGAGDTYLAPRAVAVSPPSLTGSSATSSLSISQTWNTTGTPTALQVNVTNTASNAASLLMDLRSGGVSRFAVRASDGYLTQTLNSATGAAFGVGGFGKVDFYSGFNLTATASSAEGFRVASDLAFAFSNSTTSVSTGDVFLRRDAANTLALRNGTNAQTSRVYGTFTDASNGRWLNISMTTGGVASITPTGNGTGASGNVIHISGLPTSNPGAGILWNDGGTVKVGT